MKVILCNNSKINIYILCSVESFFLHNNYTLIFTFVILLLCIFFFFTDFCF